MRNIVKSPLFIALAVALACTMLRLTDALEFAYWNGYFKVAPVHTVALPTEPIVVSLDQTTSTRSRTYVNSSAELAKLLESVLAAKPAHVYLDYPTLSNSESAGNAKLQSVIAGNRGDIDLVIRTTRDLRSVGALDGVSNTRFPGVGLVGSVWEQNFLFFAVGTSAQVAFGDLKMRSVSAAVADVRNSRRMLTPDYKVDPKQIRTIGASEVGNEIVKRALKNKIVFLSRTSAEPSNALGYFGRGRQALVYLDIAGASGAARGPTTYLDWAPLLFLFVVSVFGARRVRQKYAKLVVYSALAITLLVLPAYLFSLNIVSGNMTALIAFAIYAVIRFWQRWRKQVQSTNASSGLPTFDVLGSTPLASNHDFVVALVANYEQMLANTPRELHGDCARQIARRLSVASGDTPIYTNDAGQFVWLERAGDPLELTHHLEGMQALFSSPLQVGSQKFDTNIHFGIDRNSKNDALNRINSALASALDAASRGVVVAEYEANKLAQAPWQLSLHARIDEGLRNGDIWLAYQGQHDFSLDAINSAECLIRWNDPERGVVPPDAFILQAERSGRIDTITYWVLDQAIRASRELNASGRRFQLSVNLSARMIDKYNLLDHVREIVSRSAFDCSLLTFEVTETYSMVNGDIARRNLPGLRDMGFRLSIDDFGTGQASLAYLAEMPSDELKLDRRFVHAITTHERERLITSNMIQLAHSLGQTVVAEGVEDEQTFDTLRGMGCDLAQGYFVGRPVRLEQFREQLMKPLIHEKCG